jgi:DNA-directed RNA polymerase specialized sigma24 family protein
MAIGFRELGRGRPAKTAPGPVRPKIHCRTCNEVRGRCTIPAMTMMRGRQLREHGSIGDVSVKPGESTDRLFQLTMLRALLLQPRCRDVFVLTELHGYTLPEVARVLGISKESAKKHLRRALREMQNSESTKPLADF